MRQKVAFKGSLYVWRKPDKIPLSLEDNAKVAKRNDIVNASNYLLIFQTVVGLSLKLSLKLLHYADSAMSTILNRTDDSVFDRGQLCFLREERKRTIDRTLLYVGVKRDVPSFSGRLCASLGNRVRLS